MPIINVNVSSISWIDRALMNGFRSMPLNIFADDTWLNQLCYGMSHTSNPSPPTRFEGATYASGSTLDRQYRSLTTFTIDLEVADDGALARVRKTPNSQVVRDPGYTPPFDSNWELWKGVIGTSILSSDPTIAGKMRTEAATFSPGERSSLSTVMLPGEAWQSQGVTPLPYTSINVKAGETVLGHSLIKFRAGKQGDYIGVVAMGVPSHVPWVWCETIIAYSAPNFVLYGAGSGFPSHAFYLRGNLQGRLDLTNDKIKLKKIFLTGAEAHINYAPMIVTGFDAYPGLIVTGIDPQSPVDEVAKAGQNITAHSYTAPANDAQIRQVIRAI